MDNPQEPLPERNEESLAKPEEVVIYPPKYRKPENPTNVWLRSFVSLAFYLLIGYFIFPDYKILLLITAIVMIHELGHFIAMKAFRYNDLGIFFIPLLGAYVSGSKREVSQKESAIILLAGPLPGILIGIFFFFLWQKAPYEGLANISYYRISFLFIILNLFNLLPVYPLDGGQLLHRVFLDEESWIGKGFVFLSAGLMIWFAWRMYSLTDQPIYFLFFLFPLMMLIRLTGDSKLKSIEKKIEAEGIDMDRSYDELPDADYWRIRNILIQEHVALKDIPQAPPYEFSDKEERVYTTIQGLLHRHLIQDVSIVGKIFIILLWAAALVSPWLLGMNMGLPGR
jgi:stage IV sporulation protein FB